MADSKNNKKVFFLVYSLEGGGTERVVAGLYPVLKKKIDLKIIVFDKKNDYGIPKEDLIDLNIPASSSIIIKILVLIRRILSLKKFIRENDPSLILSFGESMNFINILACREKAVISVRSIKSITNRKSGLTGRIHDIFMKILYKSAQSIIVISQVIKNDLIRNYHLVPEKIRVIYNPVDIKGIRKNAKERGGYLKGPNSIINIGRLYYVKDQPGLINAFREIYHHDKDYLYIIGKGELENEIKNRIRQDQLENNVFLLGWQKNPFKYLAKAKIFVLSSRWEGLGNVLLEALIIGIPVISTEAGGTGYEILNDNRQGGKKIADNVFLCRYGIIVPNNDPQALAAALRYLLDNKGLQKKLRNIGQKYVEKFSMERISEQYLAVIRDALKEK